MANNENAIVSVTLATQDLLSAGSPTVINRQLLTQIYPANQVIYNGYVTTTSNVQSANFIPSGQTAAVVYFRNAGSAFLQVNTQSAQAVGSTVQTLGQGGFLLNFSPLIVAAPTPTGVALLTFALSFSGGGIGIAEVFIAI